MFLTLFSLILSLIFLFIQHPLSMGFILLLQSMTVALITGFFNFNFWYSYIIFLIMIGGMLVLFIYMTSVASNEKFKYSNKIMLLIISLIIISIPCYYFIDNIIIYQNMLNIDLMNFSSNTNWTFSLNKYLNYPMNLIMFLMIIYLFVTLIAIVKITDTTYGPLRQKL
uniref:NADH-ubiquinone oxidoreductase chain 6 n=1 Tax=Melanophila acuminata TaxID=1483931 RepID=A0A7U0R6Y7_9COLE|nr:NADH dehydrogenase subunit 6 [Melanophila acuminata]QQX28206.1 NADH dehydrogenase subunit 6 [Melanophila acuminata]